ncbi:MAG: hypothetical protein P1V81_04825 [Planctomycetota bacterium]|nr:hypothetical protein [Planctomycetota bacterium]
MRSTNILRLGLVLLATALPAAAQAPCNVWAVDTSSPQLDDRFGASLDGVGGTWVVGAPGRLGSGQALVQEVKLSGTTLAGLLWPSDLSVQDNFGASVALDGDVIVVGCPGDDDGQFGAGSAYVFERFLGSWVQTAKLQAGSVGLAASFGSAVAVQSGWIAVGAPFDSQVAGVAGRVSLFEKSGGSWVHRQDVPAGAANSRFGTSLDFDAGRLAVGQPGLGAGHVQILERFGSTWITTADLTPPGASAKAEFGCSVSLDHGLLLGGARSDSIAMDSAGAAFLFGLSGTTWSFAQRLEASTPGASDRFGAAVELHGSRALIGAPGEDSTALNAGCAHSFGRTTNPGPGGFALWSEVATYGSLGAETGAAFGSALGLDADHVWIAAPDEDTAADNAGRVHAFSFERSDCAPLAVGPLEVSASSLDRLEFVLHADPVLAGLPFFLLGSSLGTTPGVHVGGQLLPLNLLDGGYGDETLFHAGLAGPITNIGLLDAKGDGVASIDLSAIASPILQGMTLHHAYFVFNGGLAYYASPAVGVEVLF